MTWLEWTEKFQTLIVGVIGFAGVINTLLVNAWLTRRDRREVLHHERQTLRAALVEELTINRTAVVHNLETLREDEEPKGAFVPTDLMDDAYRAFVRRIGVLSQAEVSKVMNAYLSLRTSNAKLFLLGVPTETSDRHVQVPAENVVMLAGMLENLLGPVDEAIEIMKSVHDN